MLIKRPYHIIFWTVCCFLSYATDYVLYGMKIQYGLTYFVFQNGVLFYGFVYCLKKFSRKSNWLLALSVLRFLIIFVVFFAGRYYIRYYLQVDADNNPVSHSFSLKQLNIESLYWSVTYLLLASGYYYFEKSVEKERSLRMAEQQLVKKQLLVEEAQRQKIEFEQAFIQAQINPHFLYNVLSYLYSEALQYSDKMAESIHLLSDIMRYCLQPDNSLRHKVLLSKEVSYMENFIKLNQFRFDHQLQIKIGTDGDLDGVYIAPMVLMTFLENIFKHGELRNPEYPATLDIVVLGDTLSFTSRNRKRATPSRQVSGKIGLDFIKKRLTYVYAKDYKLEIENQDQYYIVHLNIFHL